MNKLVLLALLAFMPALGACREEHSGPRGAEPLPPPGADVGASGTDATATVIGEDSALVRNAHP